MNLHVQHTLIQEIFILHCIHKIHFAYWKEWRLSNTYVVNNFRGQTSTGNDVVCTLLRKYKNHYVYNFCGQTSVTIRNSIRKPYLQWRHRLCRSRRSWSQCMAMPPPGRPPRDLEPSPRRRKKVLLQGSRWQRPHSTVEREQWTPHPFWKRLR